jgi:hypothetical protein
VEAAELSVNVRHNLAKALIRRGNNAAWTLDLERAGELVDALSLVCLWRVEG